MSNNIHVLEWRDEDVAKTDNLGIVSRVKMTSSVTESYVLMLQMLQELELTVRPLSQDRSAEGLHDLLHSDRLSG